MLENLRELESPHPMAQSNLSQRKKEREKGKKDGRERRRKGGRKKEKENEKESFLSSTSCMLVFTFL